MKNPSNPNTPGKWTQFVQGAANVGAKVVGPVADAAGAISGAEQDLLKAGFHKPLAAKYDQSDLEAILATPHVAQEYKLKDGRNVKGIKLNDDKRTGIFIVADGDVDFVDLDGNSLGAPREGYAKVKEAIGKRYYECVGKAYIPGVNPGDVEAGKPFDLAGATYRFNHQGRLFAFVDEHSNGGTKIEKAHWVEVTDLDKVDLSDAKECTKDRAEAVGKVKSPFFSMERARQNAHKTGIMQGESVIAGGLLVLGSVFGIGQVMRDQASPEGQEKGFWAGVKRTGAAILASAGALLGVAQLVYSFGFKDSLRGKGEHAPDSVLKFVQQKLEDGRAAPIKDAGLQVSG